jgi:hypothetical protein
VKSFFKCGLVAVVWIVFFYTVGEFFCRLIGRFEAYFVPLLKGGKFFFFDSTLGIVEPFVVFYICSRKY